MTRSSRSFGRRRIHDNYKTRDTPVTAAALAVNLVFGIVLLASVSIQPTYATLASNGDIAFDSQREGGFHIYSMRADGSHETRLTSKGAYDWDNKEPAWSPDGSQIVFASNRNNLRYQIYTVSAAGLAETRLTNDVADDEHPAWSPDGSRIVFSSNRDGHYEIYVMNADGSAQTRLTNNPQGNLQPAWSPDGSRIAFASARDGNVEIYSMRADGTAQTRLTNNPAIEYYPVWSPDGSRIAFGSDRDGNFQIYVMNADGTAQTRLTNNGAQDIQPAWSPDGSRIAFGSDRDGNYEIYVMNADGTAQTRLTNYAFSDGNPDWQRRAATWSPMTAPGTAVTLFSVSMWGGGAGLVVAPEGWAVGIGGTIIHYVGGSWSQPVITIPGIGGVSPIFYSVYMVSPSDVWAVGGGGTIYHYDGTSWSDVSSSTTADLHSVFMVSATEGWAVGSPETTSSAATILHYDGNSWTRWTNPTTYGLSSVFMVSASEGWAVGESGTILHFTSPSWVATATPTTNHLASVFMVSASDGWAVGQYGTILHYDGTRWSTVSNPTGNYYLRSVFMVSASDGWAVGETGTILRYDGTSWSSWSWTVGTSWPTVDLYSICMAAGGGEGWAVGSGGTVLHYQVSLPLPDFNIYCDPISVTVLPGGPSVSSICTVASLNGFDSEILLTGVWWAPLAPHVTGTFSLTRVAPPAGGTITSTLTFVAGPGAEGQAGTYTYRVIGNIGTLVRSTDVPVFVNPGGAVTPDFSIHCDPVVTLPQGMSASSTCAVTSLNGFSAAVALNGAWMGTTPTGVAPTISPLSVTPPADGTAPFALTIDASGTASTGSFPYRVTGTSDTLSHTFDVTVQVTGAGGAGPVVVTLPATDITATSAVLHGTVNPNGLATVWHFMDPTGTLEICPVPIGNLAYTDSTPHDVQCTWSPLTPSTHYRYTLQAMNEAGGYAGHVNEFDTPATGPPPGGPDFSISCIPISVTVPQGASGSTSCAVTSLNGFSAAVALFGSWSGTTPTGVAPTISPVSVTPPADGTAPFTLTIDASASASSGSSFVYEVTGGGGWITHTFDVTVQITPGGAGAADFTIAACSSSLSLSPGASSPCAVSVQSVGGFSSPVVLTASGAPSGLSVAFGPTSVTPSAAGAVSSILTFTEAGATPGDYVITVTGTSGTLTHSTTLTVHVTGGGVPGFPVESILLGIVVGLFALTLRRVCKKSEFGCVSCG